MLTSRQQRIGGIVTFCCGLDRLLGGSAASRKRSQGVQLGEVTEVCGLPGSGKTQLCMQVAVDTSIPARAGGVDGSCLYIDTEGSFTPQRCNAMAMALASHLRGIARRSAAAAGADLQLPTGDEILARIHVLRCLDCAELCAAIHRLPELVKTIPGPPVRCVVVDSIAFPFRANTHDASRRARALQQLGRALASFAHASDAAVLVVNHMTTKMGHGSVVAGGDGSAVLVPALGQSWAHTTHTRLELSAGAGDSGRGCSRLACITKGVHVPLGSTEFVITQDGVRRPSSHHRHA